MSRTIIDKDVVSQFPKFDEHGKRMPESPLKDLPPPGSTLEKIFANTATTPVSFRRNREWTKYNYKPNKVWEQIEKNSQITRVIKDTVC